MVYTRTCYLPIPLLTCRGATRLERFAIKLGPGVVEATQIARLA